MKKSVAFLIALALMLSLAACSSQKNTMDEFIAANHTDVLVDAYDSVYVRQRENEVLFAEYYLTEDCTYENHGAWSMYLTDDLGYYCTDGVYSRMAFISEDGLIDCTDYRAGRAFPLLAGGTERETVQSVTESDGKITVVTTMDKRALRKMAGAEAGLEAFRCEYLFDAQTRALLRCDGALTLADGTVIRNTTECVYNGEAPEALNPIFDYIRQQEDLRTVTVVFHGGTEEEKVQQVQAPKGVFVGLSLSEESTETYGVYTDATFTEPYKENGNTEDATIYVKWGE